MNDKSKIQPEEFINRIHSEDAIENYILPPEHIRGDALEKYFDGITYQAFKVWAFDHLICDGEDDCNRMLKVTQGTEGVLEKFYEATTKYFDKQDLPEIKDYDDVRRFYYRAARGAEIATRKEVELFHAVMMVMHFVDHMETFSKNYEE